MSWRRERTSSRRSQPVGYTARPVSAMTVSSVRPSTTVVASAAGKVLAGGPAHTGGGCGAGRGAGGCGGSKNAMDRVCAHPVRRVQSSPPLWCATARVAFATTRKTARVFVHAADGMDS